MRTPINNLQDVEFDVAIIGAGVNGSSSAQHLAAMGYKVLIVDKGDFATGASSRSSRLLHCGLRYLAPGRSILDFIIHPSRFFTALRMARQAMQSREQFVIATPERTKRLRLHFPIYRDGPYREWQLRLAFKLLDAMGSSKVPLNFKMLGPEEARNVPLICGLRDFDRLQAVAAFDEYQFEWPERIALDALSRAEQNGATIRNYTKADLLDDRNGQGWSLQLMDMLSQAPPVTVRAKMVLNMAGIWIDSVNRTGKPKAKRKIFGTKGSHIVVRLPETFRGLGIATLNSLQLPFYCIPWRDLHYFGPTETPYEVDPDRVSVTQDELGFLLGEANRLLPSLDIKQSDILMTWAGVRPLTYDEAVPFGNRSRVIHDLATDGLPDMLAMTAGPIMTHRSAGEEMAAYVARTVKPRRKAKEVEFGVPGNANGYDAMPAHLSDVLFRRTGLGWSGPIAQTEIVACAQELGKQLNWDQARIADEIRLFEVEWNQLYAPPVRTSSVRPTRSD
jgi:glycerol-3-phosphate dehydrogenase